MAGRDYIGVSVGAVLTDGEGKVLLLRRKKNPEAGLWSIPGGMVEYNEKVQDALTREIKEELDVEIKVKKLLCVIDNLITDGCFHTVSLSYIVDIVQGIVRNVEKDKHSDIDWFDLNFLPRDLTVATKATLKEYEKSIINL
ncbi:MAG: NUDIX domain-containing protein [Bacteroidetes bacterium]|nr:NUDIX domain-containing protein [Bacteroidota bacterium]